MTTRLVRAASMVCAASLLVLTVPSQGATRSCRIAVDDTGDTVGLMPSDGAAPPGSSAAPSDPGLDVVSADLASDRRVITAVVRVADLGNGTPTSPVGHAYLLTFVVNEQRFTMYAMQDTSGYRRFLLVDGAEAGTTGVVVDGTFDRTHDEVRISAPLSAFGELGGHIPYGGHTTEMQVVTQRALGLQGSYTFQSADAASARVQYRFGSPSCVTPGR